MTMYKVKLKRDIRKFKAGQEVLVRKKLLNTDMGVFFDFQSVTKVSTIGDTPILWSIPEDERRAARNEVLDKIP